MKRVLFSLLVIGGVFYPAYLFFAAEDAPKPAGKSAVADQGAPAASPKIDGVEEAQAANNADALNPAIPHSRHTVEQAPSPAPAEAQPQAPAQTQPQAAAEAPQGPAPAPQSSPPKLEGGAPPSAQSAEGSPDAKPNQPEFVKVTSPASVREGPSASSAIIGIAHPGAEAQVVSRDSDWVQIIDPGSKKTGWIHQSFLAPQAEPASRPVSQEEIDAALAAPTESNTASADSESSVKSRSHKHGWKHGRHRHGFAWGFILRRVW
jgi:SH3-like domain-containing protein